MIARVVTYTFLGAMAVLVIMNAGNFATATGAVANLWVRETQVLSGAGYNGAKPQ